MAGFDAKAYKASVLRAYSKGEQGEQLREVLAEISRDPSSRAYARLDLNLVFGVPTPVDEAALKAWRPSITSTLNKASSLPGAKLIKQLLEVLDARGLALDDPAFWGGLQAQRQQYILGALDEKVKQLRGEYPLGVVTVSELVARLETVGITGVTEGSIRKVAADNDLDIVPEIELPADGIPEGIRAVWQRTSQHTEYRSILDVLLLHRPDDVTNVTFIDALSTPSGPISLSDIDKARAKSEQGRDSNALQDAQKLLVAVKNVCADGAALKHIVVTTVADSVEKQLSRGKPKVAVRDQLVSAGIAAIDAARIVSALGARAGEGAGPSIGLGAVRQALSDGELAKAERTLAAIAPDDEEKADHAALQADLEARKARKASALRDYQSALDRKDYSAALSAITEAISIDAGDDSLAARRDALPPAAPRSFAVRVDGNGVLASWAQQADAGIAYTVVRGEAHTPASPLDGHIVASRISDSTVRDESAPVGARVDYAVFATRDGSVYSDAATATALVVPPPTGLAATSDLTSVQVTWNIPASSVGVVVTRQDPDGSTSETEVLQGTTMRADGLITGARYRFSARAIYLLDGGRQLSEPVAITVAPRGEAREVRDLQIVDTGDGLRAMWSDIGGYDVELWSFPATTTLPEGESVDQAALDRLQGTRTAVLPDTSAGGSKLAPFRGFARIAPLTVVDGGYLVGFSEVAGEPIPATNITAEAFGDDLRLSWAWPTDDCMMQLSWTQDGRERTRRVTPARYRADGGATIVGGTNATDLGIATVMRFDGDESVLARVPIPWSPSTASTHRATYEMRIRRSLLGKVTCEVIATSEATGFSIPARVVFKRGGAIPWDADDGRAVETIELDFRTATTSRHEVEIGKEKSPFWVCVFALDGSELVPPSTRDLKG